MMRARILQTRTASEVSMNVRDIMTKEVAFIAALQRCSQPSVEPDFNFSDVSVTGW